MSTPVVYCATCGAANPPEATACFACGNPPLAAPLQLSGDAGLAGVAPTVLLASRALLKQRYRLLAQVGQGGFGAVYLAEDTELGNRKVAVKEMSQRSLLPEEVQEATRAFRNEALLLASLAHPNLPRIYEQFSEDGHWYLVMDFIEGETLEDRLSHAPGGRLPVAEVLKLGLQLCTVLEYLHTRQPPIIFRDLKPANIMVTPGGDLSLIDFGIARHFKPGQTKDTIAFGSAGYAAPEQYGKAQTTTRSDIYSLGATLHQLLSGADPADTPFLFAPLHLAEPDGLEPLMMQMLETQPSKRPASMAEIKEDLQRMADDLATGRKQQRTVAAPVSSSPKHAHVPLHLFYGHSACVNSVAWSPDGKTIASGGNDRTVQVWESTTGVRFHTYMHAGEVCTLVWSPNGEQIAWLAQASMVNIWNPHTNDFNNLWHHRPGFARSLLALGWSLDGSRLAAGGMGRTVEVWEVRTTKHLLSYKGHQQFLGGATVYALAWSPDGQWIASADEGTTIQVWEVVTGRLRCTYRECQFGWRGGVAWSPDGQRIASAGDKATVHIWDAASGMQRLLLNGGGEKVNAVAWSPNGTYVAAGSSDQTVRVWDVVTGKEPHAYSHHHGAVRALAWSPDSTRLASAGDDGKVRVWQVR